MRESAQEEIEMYKELENPAPKGKIWKSDGNGNEFLVDDPDFYNEEGRRVKLRKKPTNITPKKKKRK